MAANKDHINLRPAVLVVALLICFGIFTGCKPDPAPSSSKGTSSVKTSSVATSSPVSGSSALPSSIAPSSSKASSSRPPASSSQPPSSVPPASSSQSSPVSSEPDGGTAVPTDVELLYSPAKGLHISLTYFQYTGNLPPQKHPLVIFFHDGAWDNPKGYTELDSTLKYARDEFLKLGYAVASCQYLRETGTNLFPQPVADASDAIRHIVSIAPERNLDPQRIILMGKGAGAHTALMAAYAGSRYSSQSQTSAVKVQAVIALSALTSLKSFFEYPDEANKYKTLRQKVVNYLDTFYTSDAPDYKATSPLAQIHKDIPYCFLFASDSMYNQQANDLAKAVRELGGDVNDAIAGAKNTPEGIFGECMDLIDFYLSAAEE